MSLVGQSVYVCMYTVYTCTNCVFPENIHTLLIEGFQKFHFSVILSFKSGYFLEPHIEGHIGNRPHVSMGYELINHVRCW